MSLSDTCSDLPYSLKRKPAPEVVSAFLASVEHYANKENREITDCLIQLGRAYLSSSRHDASHEELEATIIALKDSAEAVRGFLDSNPSYKQHRKLIVEDGKIVIRVNEKKEVQRLIAELDATFQQLVILSDETGLRLFGLGDVHKGLQLLKGEKSE
jgi:hypothetical protein